MQPVVIVGGGIIGLCTAFALHQRGVPVTVLDAGPAERAASHVNAGWIVPTLAAPVPAPGLIATSLRWMLRSDSPLYIRPRLDPAFLRWTLRFWRHCNARDFLAGTEAIAAFGARSLALYDAMREAGVRYEEHRDGLLFAYRTTGALEHDYAALEPVRRFGFEISPIMSGDELRALEPSLSETVSGGYWLPQERSVRPDTLVRGLIAYLQERGVEVRRDTPVERHRERRRQGARPSSPGDSASPPRRSSSPPEPGRRASSNRCGCASRSRPARGTASISLQRRTSRRRCGDRSTCTRRASPLPRWTA